MTLKFSTQLIHSCPHSSGGRKSEVASQTNMHWHRQQPECVSIMRVHLVTDDNLDLQTKTVSSLHNLFNARILALKQITVYYALSQSLFCEARTGSAHVRAAGCECGKLQRYVHMYILADNVVRLW